MLSCEYFETFKNAFFEEERLHLDNIIMETRNIVKYRKTLGITKPCTQLHPAPSTSTQLHPAQSTSTQLISAST